MNQLKTHFQSVKISPCSALIPLRASVNKVYSCFLGVFLFCFFTALVKTQDELNKITVTRKRFAQNVREKAVSALQSGMTEARVVRRFGAHRCTISRPWERRAPSGIQLNTWGTIWTVEYSGCWIFDLKAMFSALASLPLFDCHIWVRKDVQITGLTAAINNNNNGLTLS